MNQTTAKRERRWFQFRLRTLLLIVTAIGIALAIPVNRAAQQRRRAAAILDAGSTVYYTYQFDPSGNLRPAAEPAGPTLLRKLLGDDFFTSIARVDLQTNHEQLVQCVAYSADGNTLATADLDGTVKLWDSATCRPLGVLRGFPESIFAVAFSPDGNTLATAGGWNNPSSALVLWSVHGRQKLAVLEGHSDVVLQVAFSPDGKTLATASIDGTVRVWDVATASERATLSVRNTALSVRSVAFSPDGRTLASGDNSGNVWFWDATSWTKRSILKGHSDELNDVAYSPGGRLLATASSDHTVKLWNVDTLDQHTTLSHPDSVESLSFAPSGDLLATGSRNDAVRLWDVTTGKIEAVLPRAGFVRFSPYGNTLAVAALPAAVFPPTVQLWDIAAQRHFVASYVASAAVMGALLFWLIFSVALSMLKARTHDQWSN